MSIKTDAVAQHELGIPSKSDSLSEKLASDAPSVAELPELQMPWSCKGLGEDRPLRSSRMYCLSFSSVYSEAVGAAPSHTARP